MEMNAMFCAEFETQYQRTNI